MKRRAPSGGIKLLLFLLALLVAGAIINLAVAICFWGFGARPKSGTFESVSQWTSTPSIAQDFSMWERGRSDGWPTAPRQTLRQSKFGMRYAWMFAVINEFDPVGLTPEQWSEQARLRQMFMVESVQVGWPGALLSFEQATSLVNWPLVRSSRRVGSQFGFRWIPTTILWRGFAINTIFYAAMLWMLFTVPGAVRRRLRIKRGQCASCGYSLRDITSEKCPECGATA